VAAAANNDLPALPSSEPEFQAPESYDSFSYSLMSPNPNQERVLQCRVSKTHAKRCNPLSRNRYRYCGVLKDASPRLVCKECRRVLLPAAVMGFTLRTRFRISRRRCAPTLCRS
jgi:hypothetical protein